MPEKQSKSNAQPKLPGNWTPDGLSKGKPTGPVRPTPDAYQERKPRG